MPEPQARSAWGSPRDARRGQTRRARLARAVRSTARLPRRFSLHRGTRRGKRGDERPIHWDWSFDPGGGAKTVLVGSMVRSVGDERLIPWDRAIGRMGSSYSFYG